jgi:hypothetical protein
LLLPRNFFEIYLVKGLVEMQNGGVIGCISIYSTRLSASSTSTTAFPTISGAGRIAS